MKIELTGKPAILFARVWGVVAMLFGLFLISIAVHDLFGVEISPEQIVIKIALVGFGIGSVLLGRFFFRTKMSAPAE